MGEQNESHISLFKKGYEAQKFTQDSNQQRQLQFEGRQPSTQLDHNQLEFLKGVTAALSNLHRVPFAAQLPQPRPLLPSQQGQPSLDNTQQLNNLLANYPILQGGEVLGSQHVIGGGGTTSTGGGTMQMGEDGQIEDSSSGPRTDYNDVDDGNTSKKRRARTPQQQERNKLAQQRYRERCKNRHKEMEQALNKYNSRINKLENENKYLRDSDHTLRRQIQQLRSENSRLKNVSSQPPETQQTEQVHPVTSSPSFTFQQPPSSTPQPQQHYNNGHNTNLVVLDEEQEDDQLMQVLQSAETIQIGIQHIISRRIKRKLSQDLEEGEAQGQELGLNKVQRLLGQQDVHYGGLQQHQEEELLMRSRDLGVEQQTRDLLQRYQSFINKEQERSCQVAECQRSSQNVGEIRGEDQRYQDVDEGTQLQECDKQQEGGVSDSGQVIAEQERQDAEAGLSLTHQPETGREKEDEDTQIALHSFFQHITQQKGEVSREQFSNECKSKFGKFIPEFLGADPLNLNVDQKMENLSKTIRALLDVGNMSCDKFIERFMTDIKEKQHFLHEYIYSETRRLVKDFCDKLERNSASVEDLLQVARGIVVAIHVKQED